MRSEKDIRAKLDEYLTSVQSLPWWEEEAELRCMIIDTLLWVIEDESGKPI